MKYSNLRKTCSNQKLFLQIIILGLSVLTSFESYAQFRHESLTKTNATFFTLDHLDNIYLTESGAVAKIFKSTGEKKHFSNPMYGNFDFIDSSDPLNIIAFSSSLGVITFLDKNLVEKETFKTDGLTFSEKPELICNSRLEGFWVFFPELMQIFRINRKNQVLTSTPSLNQLGYSFSKPCFMIEAGSRLYVSDPENGIFVFDMFGSFLFKLPLKNICTFQVIDNYIVYFTKKQLCLYNFFHHDERLILLPEDKIKMGFVNYPYIYILFEKGIIKYYTNIELF